MIVNPVRILLFEDNPGDARILQEYLRENNPSLFELEHVTQLSEGIQKLEFSEPDVILLDLGLPDSQGLQTFTRVQEVASNLPVVILTGLDDSNRALKAVKSGAQDYLVKGDISAGVLTRAVRYSIERKSTEVKINNQAQLLENNAQETQKRLSQLETIYASSFALSQILEPKKIGEKVIEVLSNRLEWHHVTIRTFNPTNERLELLAFHQPNLEKENEKRKSKKRFEEMVSVSGEGLSGWAFQHNQFVYSGNVKKDPRYVDVQPGIQSGIYAPMKVGNRAIGVISIESDQLNAFTETDEWLLTTLAQQAASALENARLFDETNQRVKQLESINRISVALRVGSKQDQMLAIVLEETLSTLKSRDGSIYLRNKDNGQAEKLLSKGRLSDSKKSNLPVEEGLFGMVHESKRSFISEEFSADPRIQFDGHQNFLMGLGGACIPIYTPEEVIGMLLIAIPSQRRFSQDEIRYMNTAADITGTALHRKKLNNETERRLRNLQALRTIDRTISSTFDLPLILNTVIDQVIAQLEVDAANILILHSTLKELEYIAGKGFKSHQIESRRLRLGECYAGKAALKQELVHIPNLPEMGSDFKRASLLLDEKFVEYYAVPLQSQGNVLGVLEVFHRKKISSEGEWLDLLETLAGQAAIAIDNVQLFENLKRSNLDLTMAYDATIEGWSRAMDLRDKETEGHTQRVAKLAVQVAQALGMENNKILHLRRGALLHDIGKLGIPDRILLKSEKLTKEEWELMQKHPVFAFEMLQPIEYLRESIEIPYHHHEKWDGTGYPHGLKGKQIPIEARIFALADVFDALTSDRPYRPAWTKKRAVEYIEENAGTHFDPEIVPVFLEIIKEQFGI